MEITIPTGVAAFLGVWYYFVSNCPWNFNLGFIGLQKPIFGGWLVGVLLGDMMTGLQMGAAIQVLYIANISAGGSQAADPAFAGIVGVALAMASGATYQEALILAVPLGLVGNMRTMLHMTINSFVIHGADAQARKGSYWGVWMYQVGIPAVLYCASAFIMVFLSLTLGPTVVSAAIANMPAWITKGLNTVGGILPAVGICMSLNLIFRKNTAPFFFLGFVLQQYLGYSGIILAVIGAIIAYVATFGVKPSVGGAE